MCPHYYSAVLKHMPAIWKCGKRTVHSCCDAWFTVQWRSFDWIFCGRLTPHIHKLSRTQRQLCSVKVLIIRHSLNRFQGNLTQVAKTAASNQTPVLSFHKAEVSASNNHVHSYATQAVQLLPLQGHGGLPGVHASLLWGKFKKTSWTCHQQMSLLLF